MQDVRLFQFTPKTLRTAARAYGMYESVYHVKARYSTITKTKWEM